MSAVLEENSSHPDSRATAPVVVVGTGPVGVCFVEELLRRKPDSPIVIYGNAHKDSPRRDFKLGDVMGSVVIRIPLEG